MANLESSYLELTKSFSYTPRNFQLTRNIPIDTRFLVTTLDNIDSEILPETRYPGLVFFVRDSAVNDGTSNSIDTIDLGPINQYNKGSVRTVKGILYIFVPDASGNLIYTPLHDLINRFEIKLLNITDTSNTAYSHLCDGDLDELSNHINANNTNCLNHLYAKLGNIVYIQPLGIAVICVNNNESITNKTKWIYFSGTYKVSSIEQFNNIPDSLKNPNTVVSVNGKNQIITSDLKLSDEVIKKSSVNDCTENNRYYNINGFIYYHIDGITIPVSNKFCIKQQSLKVGNNYIDLSGTDNINIFESNFNTSDIIVDCIFESNSINGTKYANTRFPLEHKIINSNVINIISSIDIDSVRLLIRSNS